jgi:hypothetical protein
MTLSQVLAPAVIGGFFAWLLQRSLTIFVIRRRLLAYLTTVLNVHFHNVKDNQTWLGQVLLQTIAEGRLIDGAPIYTKDSLSDLTEVRQRCFELLTRSELIKLTKCINCLWETEGLFDSFCFSLRKMQDTGKALTSDDVFFLQKRANRINAHIDRIPSVIRSINELRDDYAGTISAATLVVPGKQPRQTSS